MVDDSIAMRASAYGRPLTMANVEKHLEAVGLEAEFASHMRIRALSGGQKVKVVLAAALWNCPHLIILDEVCVVAHMHSVRLARAPSFELHGRVRLNLHRCLVRIAHFFFASIAHTHCKSLCRSAHHPAPSLLPYNTQPTNYLDRESLGALAQAIREFEGGVVIISHNSQFVDGCTNELWQVEGGKVNLKGDPEWLKSVEKEKIVQKEQAETALDKFGNEVKVKSQKKKLSRQELKKKEKIRKARLAQGLPVSDDEDDWE